VAKFLGFPRPLHQKERKSMTQTLLSPQEATRPAADFNAVTGRSDRDTIKHLLIGSPRSIRHTIHVLHNLQYAEAGLWSPLIAIPHHQLILTSNQGEMMSLLMRYIRFESSQ
jgi:hypothetical protein